jgi:hypothetical protein
MDRSSPVTTLRRRAAMALAALGCVLLLGASPVAADEDEKPTNVVAFPNSPGMITLTWTHSGEDVFWFVLEQEAPAAVLQVDRDKRAWTVPSLEPSRTYRYRVCAVFAYSRKCSDEDGAGLACVTSLPPPAPGGGGSAGGAPPPPSSPQIVPRPLYSPVIRALPVRVAAGAQPLVELRWVNPVDSQQFTLLKALEWQRDGAFVGSTSIPTFVDTQQLNALHRYRLCVANPVNRICSEEVTAGSFGLAASFESLNRRKHFLRHRNWLGVLTPVNNHQDSEDIAFFVRPGLTGDARAVSFESVNFPKHFLRHQGYRIKLHKNDDTELFRKDATFWARPGLRNAPDMMSFEAVNVPGHFIRHQNFELWIARNDGSNLFQEDGTFRQATDYVSHLKPPVPVQATPKTLNAARRAPSSAALRAMATCKSGFVWREARSSDLVCVTPASRAKVTEENRNAAQGVQPGAAPTCRSGLVWREAFSGDVVCVPPGRRDEVREENRVGPTLRAQQ